MSRPPALIAREPELGRIRGLLQHSHGGPAGALLIEGPPGIGKTRLAEEAVRMATELGSETHAGSARELDQGRPFGVLLDALDIGLKSPHPERADIARLLASDVEYPGDLPGQAPLIGYRVTEAIVDLLERRAIEGPTLLVLEDMQWADVVTLGTIDRLLLRSRGLPMALLLTARPLPRTPELDALVEELREHGGGLLPVGPLDQAAVEALATEALGGRPGPNLSRLLAGAGGNPFFLTALIDTLRDEERIADAGGTVDIPRPESPPTVRLVILRRLSFMAPDTMRALRTAAVLGSSFRVTDLATVMERPVESVAAILDQALRADLLRDREGMLTFVHDLVREAIYEDLPAAVRLPLHREVAGSLRAAGATPLSIAPHLAIGAEPGDEEAVEALAAAAVEAMPRDPGLGADLLERAIGLATPGRRRVALQIELLRAHYYTGRFPAAEELGASMLEEGLDPSDDASVRSTLGLILSHMNRWPDALTFLDGIDEAALPDEQRSRLLAHRSLVLLPCGQLERAQREARLALELATGDQAVITELQAHHTLAHAHALVGSRLDAAEEVRRAVALKRADHTGQGRLFPVEAMGSSILLAADLMDEADLLNREGTRIAEELGLTWSLHLHALSIAWRHCYLGEWDDAVAGLETTLALGDELNARGGVVASNAILAHIHLHRGDLDAAERAILAAEQEVAERGGMQYQIHRAMWARALLVEARGDPTGAHQMLAGTIDLLIGAGWTGELPDLAPDAVRLALAAGDVDRARATTEAMERLPDIDRVATVRGAARRCRGLLESDAAILLEAVEAYRRGPRPLDLALACEDAAAARARGGRALLEEALDTYRAIGADRDADRAASKLRSMGVRRGSRGPRRRPATGWESLTPAEERVAGLAAEGLTNSQIGERLFLSRHTVGTHLRHVFAKLGLSSRVELARSFAGRSG